MTRLGPCPEEGPLAQPHIRQAPNMTVIEFSVHIHYKQHSINVMVVVQCVLSRGQAVNPVLSTMLQCVQLRGGQLLSSGQ